MLGRLSSGQTSLLADTSSVSTQRSYAAATSPIDETSLPRLSALSATIRLGVLRGAPPRNLIPSLFSLPFAETVLLFVGSIKLSYTPYQSQVQLGISLWERSHTRTGRAASYRPHIPSRRGNTARALLASLGSTSPQWPAAHRSVSLETGFDINTHKTLRVLSFIDRTSTTHLCSTTLSRIFGCLA
jgi:hypothetical protein